MGLDPLSLLPFNRKCLKRRTLQLGECSGIVQSPTYLNPFPANEHVSVMHNRHSYQWDLVTTNIHFDYCAPLSMYERSESMYSFIELSFWKMGRPLPRVLNGRHGLKNVMLLYIKREVKKPWKSTSFIFFFIIGLWMHMYFHGNCPHLQSAWIGLVELLCNVFLVQSPKECWSAVHLCLCAWMFRTSLQKYVLADEE